MASAKARAVVLGTALAAVAASSASAQQAPSTRAEIQELRRLVQQQQQVISNLQNRVDTLAGQQSQDQERVQSVQKQVQESRQTVADKNLVGAGEKKVKLELSGQINRAVNVAADGKSTKGYFVDNNNSNSRFRLLGTYKASDDLSVAAAIELAVRPNNSTEVSQDNESAGDSFEERKVESIFDSKRLGTIYFGRGDPSTKDIARQDLSGTDIVAYANTGNIAGGLQFLNDNTPTGTTLSNAFSDLDPGRQNRVRYDTPHLGGFYASGSYAENERYYGALKYAAALPAFKIASGVGYSNPNINGSSGEVAGSASLLSTTTGLSLTAAGGDRFSNDSDPWFTYIKAGYQASFIDEGKTYFTVDWQHSKNEDANNSRGNSYGITGVQSFTDLGTELYAQFRTYTLNGGDGPDPDSVYVGTIGTRIKF